VEWYYLSGKVSIPPSWSPKLWKESTYEEKWREKPLPKFDTVKEIPSGCHSE
jgi:hypothetical protein